MFFYFWEKGIRREHFVLLIGVVLMKRLCFDVVVIVVFGVFIVLVFLVIVILVIIVVALILFVCLLILAMLKVVLIVFIILQLHWGIALLVFLLNVH